MMGLGSASSSFFSRAQPRPCPSQGALPLSPSSHQLKPSPSPDQASTLAAIQSSGVIACLRAQSGELAMEAARAALNGGIAVLEITMTTPDVFEVGTVLNDMDAKSAIKAGARFLMSPAMVKDILDDVGEVLYIPGVMTPTEVLNAHNAGAQVVKVYPVSVLGGVQYITALKKSFSHIPMVASQGITLDSIGAYIHGGASAVLLSDAIFEKDAMRKRNYDRIHELACRAALQGKEIKCQIQNDVPSPLLGCKD